MCVRVTVAVNAVCSGQACNAWVRCAFVHNIVLRLTRAISATQQLHNIDSKWHTAAPHTRNKRLISNRVTESADAQHCLRRDVTDVCSASYVPDGKGCTK